MPWFEAKDEIQLSPNRYVQPGDLFEYPYRAGRALVSANRAEWAEAPTSGDAAAAAAAETPTDDGAENDTPAPKQEGDSEMQKTSIDEMDFTAVDGIGEETADEIDKWLADEGIETGAALADRGLTALPGVGASTAADIRDVFEEL